MAFNGLMFDVNLRLSYVEKLTKSVYKSFWIVSVVFGLSDFEFLQGFLLDVSLLAIKKNLSSSLDGRLSALPSLAFDESRQKVDV